MLPIRDGLMNTLGREMNGNLYHFKYLSLVSICKYLLTKGLREQNIYVTQLWPG